MLRAIHNFAGKLKVAGSNAVGFLYYSGHGIASAGENMMLKPYGLETTNKKRYRQLNS